MHYMYANRNTGITYNSHGNLEPVCYYDSGYNQKHLGTKPQYSYIIMWAGAAIIWKSKRHKSTPNSVSEAEFMTLGHATRWILWLRKVITDMGFGEWVNRPTLMMVQVVHGHWTVCHSMLLACNKGLSYGSSLWYWGHVGFPSIVLKNSAEYLTNSFTNTCKAIGRKDPAQKISCIHIL